MPKKKSGRLTAKQAKFVEAYTTHGDGKRALIEAGYNPGSKTVHERMTKNLFKHPLVSNAIKERIREMFPKVEERVISKLMQIIETGSDGNAIRAIQVLSQFMGWNAPTKHVRTTVDVNRLLQKYKLPGITDGQSGPSNNGGSSDSNS